MEVDSNEPFWSAWGPLPKPDLFWKKASGVVGDGSPDQLWRNVGLALTTYEHLEEELARLFQFFIESKSNAAAKAYGASSGRQNLLAEASQAFFLRRNGFIIDIEECKNILKHYSRAAAFRNEVAHGIVRGFKLSDTDTDTDTNAVWKWFLVAPSYNSLKTGPSTGYRHSTYRLNEVDSTYLYNSKTVEDCALKCRKLQNRVQYFLMEIIQVYDHDVHMDFEKVPQIYNRDNKRRLND